MKRSSVAKASLTFVALIIAAMAEERVPLQMVTKLREIVRAAMDKEAVDKAVHKSIDKTSPETEHGEAQGVKEGGPSRAAAAEEIEAEEIKSAEEGENIETLRFEGAPTTTDEVKVPVAAKPEEDEYKEQEDAADEPAAIGGIEVKPADKIGKLALGESKEEEEEASIEEKTLKNEHEAPRFVGAPILREIEKARPGRNAGSEAAADAAPLKVMAATGTPENLALSSNGATATQSSGNGAGKAIDGNTSGRYSDGSVTHTNHEGQRDPWWRVDLGTFATINTIKIYNRSDSQQARIDGAKVEIKGTPNGPALAWAIGVGGRINAGQDVYELHFSSVTGRYVQVSLEGDGRILSLAEVQVYGRSEHCPLPLVVPNSDGWNSLFSFKGAGSCRDRAGYPYDHVKVSNGECTATYTENSWLGCARYCAGLPTRDAPALRGFSYRASGSCYCNFDSGDSVFNADFLGTVSDTCRTSVSTTRNAGKGPIYQTEYISDMAFCFAPV